MSADTSFSIGFRTGTAELWRPRVVLGYTGRLSRSAHLRPDLDEIFEHLIGLDQESTAPSGAEVDYERLADKYVYFEHHELLQDLTEKWGLPWSLLARIVGVSVPAVRKWRRGGDISEGNKVELAKLAALCETLNSTGITSPADWIRLRVRRDVDTRWADVVQSGRVDLVLAYAEGRVTAEDVLDEHQPRWRLATERTELAPGEDGSVLRVAP